MTFSYLSLWGCHELTEPQTLSWIDSHRFSSHMTDLTDGHRVEIDILVNRIVFVFG